MKHKLAIEHRDDGLWREMQNRAKNVTRKLAQYHNRPEKTAKTPVDAQP